MHAKNEEKKKKENKRSDTLLQKLITDVKALKTFAKIIELIDRSINPFGIKIGFVNTAEGALNLTIIR